MTKRNSYILYIFISLFVLMLAFYLRGNMETITYQKYELEEFANTSFFNMSILVMSVIGGVFIFLNKGYVRNSAMTRISIFLLWVSFISYVRSVAVPLDSLLFYLTIPLNIIILFTFYLLIQKMEKKTFFWIVISLLFAYLLTYYIRDYSILTLFIGMNDVLLNSSYFFLLFLPVLLLLPNSYLKLLLIFVVFTIVILSNKRTGTIAFALSLFCYVLVALYLQPKSLKKLIANVFVSLVTIFALFYILQSIDTEYFINRFSSIEEDGGSGRDVIWMKSLNMIESSNFLDLLIGHGWNMVSKDSASHLSAHCDFIEVIYDFGVIGFALYMNVYVTMLKVIRHLIRIKSNYASPAVFSFVSVFILSISSHIIIYPYLSFIVFSFWGILLAYTSNLKLVSDNNLISK